MATQVQCNVTAWPYSAISQVARGAKNFGPLSFQGPQKTEHFWKVHYLALVILGGVYHLEKRGGESKDQIYA